MIHELVHVQCTSKHYKSHTLTDAAAPAASQYTLRAVFGVGRKIVAFQQFRIRAQCHNLSISSTKKTDTLLRQTQQDGKQAIKMYVQVRVR